MLLLALLLAAETPLTALPYTPSLDVSAMDTAIDPCSDFYAYSCGGWMKKNPIPADQASWSVYGKMADDNARYLWGLLSEEAAKTTHKNETLRKLGDAFAACMDEKAIDDAGLGSVADELKALDALADKSALGAWIGAALLRAPGGFFDLWVEADAKDSSRYIIALAAGGLGLPDRDYYLKTDARSKELRGKYLEHVERMLTLGGVSEPKKNAAKIIELETALAKASLTRVEKRDPYKIYHRTSDLTKTLGAFPVAAFWQALGITQPKAVNVTEPAFFAALAEQVKARSLDELKTYARFHVLNGAAHVLPRAFDDAHFQFYRKTLRGTEAQPPRWKRCVRWADEYMGEALGQLFVDRNFSPELKQATLSMVLQIEATMKRRIEALGWMSAETKKKAQDKLAKMANKIGYPNAWRDYTALAIKRGAYAENSFAAGRFDMQRRFARLDQTVDRDEWEMTPPSVNAYYNPSMNDMNFPAGVLQPPLYDPKLDSAPNYGDTGSTVGHELIHGFDDEGRQFDAAGNLSDWWTKADAKAFAKQAQCVVDQYAGYTVIDDIKINSKLTLGEDLADLAGTILAYEAWRETLGKQAAPEADGLNGEQRFFVGFAQWVCSNQRPELERLNAATNPHSPPKYRINGVVANMAEFAAAFACKAGAPMVKQKVCKVW